MCDVVSDSISHVAVIHLSLREVDANNGKHHPSEYDDNADIEYPLDRLQQGRHQNLHGAVVGDETQRPQGTEESQNLQEAQINLNETHIYDGDNENEKVQGIPRITEIGALIGN